LLGAGLIHAQTFVFNGVFWGNPAKFPNHHLDNPTPTSKQSPQTGYWYRKDRYSETAD